MESWNKLTNIICPDLNYNDRTIKAVVNSCTEIESYIKIKNLTDKSVTWISRVGNIDRFNCVKNTRSRKTTSNTPHARKLAPARKFHSLKSNLNPSLNSSITTSLSKDNVATLPTTIHIKRLNYDNSFEKREISAIKLTAIAEINQAVDTAKTTAIDYLKQDYNTILSDWDTTKAELDAETQLALKDIQAALKESSQVSNNVSQANKYLNDTKQDVEEIRQTIKQLDLSVDSIVSKAKNAVANATKHATDEAISACTNDLHETNQDHIANMEAVFSENMGLMQDLQRNFNPHDMMNETTTFTDSAIAKLKQESATILQEFTS